MIIRHLSNKSIRELVQVHIDAFPNFFLTDLGQSFLETYYKSVQEEESGVVLAYEEDGRIIGFCAGCVLSKGFNSKLVKHNLYEYGLLCVRLCFTHPKKIVHLIKNFTKSASVEDKGQYAELLSIGVSPSVQNSGVGKILLSELEKDLKFKGASELSLTTDFYENEKVLRFYSKMGFKPFCEFTAYPNRKMYRLIKNL